MRRSSGARSESALLSQGWAKFDTGSKRCTAQVGCSGGQSGNGLEAFAALTA
jgi:hypothetical protein